MSEKPSAVTELPAVYAKITNIGMDKSTEVVITTKGETSEKAFELFHEGQGRDKMSTPPPVVYPKCPKCGIDLDTVTFIGGKKRVHSISVAYNEDTKQFIPLFEKDADVIATLCYYCEEEIELPKELIYSRDEEKHLELYIA